MDFVSNSVNKNYGVFCLFPEKIICGFTGKQRLSLDSPQDSDEKYALDVWFGPRIDEIMAKNQISKYFCFPCLQNAIFTNNAC